MRVWILGSLFIQSGRRIAFGDRVLSGSARRLRSLRDEHRSLFARLERVTNVT
jgi:hypothetical protein